MGRPKWIFNVISLSAPLLIFARKRPMQRPDEYAEARKSLTFSMKGFPIICGLCIANGCGEVITNIYNERANRVLVLDGAMGTMIQRYMLDESRIPGQPFSRFSLFLKGNNDLLSLTQPQIVTEIHEKYLRAERISSKPIPSTATGSSYVRLPTWNPLFTRSIRRGSTAAEAAKKHTRLTRGNPGFCCRRHWSNQ